MCSVFNIERVMAISVQPITTVKSTLSAAILSCKEFDKRNLLQNLVLMLTIAKK